MSLLELIVKLSTSLPALESDLVNAVEAIKKDTDGQAICRDALKAIVGIAGELVKDL